jgi:hypothetical protein
MFKRIIYLIIPVIIFAGTGLTAVQKYFSSFPPSKTVIGKFIPSEHMAPAIDLTETFFDDSGSMKGYYGERYIEFLRTLKSHINVSTTRTIHILIRSWIPYQAESAVVPGQQRTF